MCVCVSLQSSLGKMLPSGECSDAQWVCETNTVRCSSSVRIEPRTHKVAAEDCESRHLLSCKVILLLSVHLEDQKDPFALIL